MEKKVRKWKLESEKVLVEKKVRKWKLESEKVLLEKKVRKWKLESEKVLVEKKVRKWKSSGGKKVRKWLLSRPISWPVLVHSRNFYHKQKEHCAKFCCFWLWTTSIQLSLLFDKTHSLLFDKTDKTLW